MRFWCKLFNGYIECKIHVPLLFEVVMYDVRRCTFQPQVLNMMLDMVEGLHCITGVLRMAHIALNLLLASNIRHQTFNYQRSTMILAFCALYIN